MDTKVHLLSLLVVALAGTACADAADSGGDASQPVDDAGSSSSADASGDVSADAVASDAATPDPDVTPPQVDAVPDSSPPDDELFSFFVTSLEGMQKLSGSLDGFGGDLGGLDGADEICRQLASDVGGGHKTWRAFLSVTQGPDGGPVHAIDRIGEGPWYDRNARLVAASREDLLHDRPIGDPQVVDDLPNEYGQGQKQYGDNHDTLTGSNEQGMLNDPDPVATCQDWTSAVGPGSEKRVMGGHSWPREAQLNPDGEPQTVAPPPWVNACASLSVGEDCEVDKGKKKFVGVCELHPEDESIVLCMPPDGQLPGGPGGGNDGVAWINSHTVPGCAPGVQLLQEGGGQDTDIVGGGGGYGGIYCFALEP